MKSQVEKMKKSVVKIRMEVENELFQKAVNEAYFKNAKKFTIPGFRKGKAPKNIIERYYGEGVFYEDAIESVFQEQYPQVVRENNLEPVESPTLEVEQIGKDKDLVLVLKVTVKPEVTLGQYKGIEIEKVEYNVTDEDVENEILKAAQKNARIKTVEDRAIKEEDIATISYKGTIDGEEFEGGSSEEHKLTIGSGEFIAGFEEQLIGAKVNDEIKVNVTFPEAYFKEELSGKPAVFDVKVLKIEEKELPTIDDEFAKDVSEFDTLEEYKNDIRKDLEQKAKDKEKIEKENKVLDKVLENATVEIPEVMITKQVDRFVHDFEHQISHQGIDLNTYLMYTGTKMEDLREHFKEKAQKEVKLQLVIEKILSQETIEVSDEEVKQEIENLAKVYNVKEENFFGRFSDEEKEYVRNTVKVRKCVQDMVDSAKIKD